MIVVVLYFVLMDNSMLSLQFVGILSVVLQIGSAYAQPSDEADEVLSELADIKEALDRDLESWIQIGLAVGAIVASILGGIWLYNYSQRKQENEAISRSCIALARELTEIEDGLVSTRQARTRYALKTAYILGDSEIQEVSYVNAYFVTDAYDSVLSSGFLSYFKEMTQHEITELYARIRSHNELLTHMNHFEDQFFMNDTSSNRFKEWGKAIERYEATLTAWENEMKILIDVVKKQIDKERPK